VAVVAVVKVVMVMGRHMVMLCMAMARMILRLGFTYLRVVAALTIRAARSAFGCVWIQNLKRAGLGVFVRCHDDLPISETRIVGFI
jgi:hypothetical protein